jgi:hypothetical protein
MYTWRIERLDVPVKVRLELGAVVGLDDEDPERETTNDLVDEVDGSGLGAGVVALTTRIRVQSSIAVN